MYKYELFLTKYTNNEKDGQLMLKFVYFFMLII